MPHLPHLPGQHGWHGLHSAILPLYTDVPCSFTGRTVFPALGYHPVKGMHSGCPHVSNDCMKHDSDWMLKVEEKRETCDVLYAMACCFSSLLHTSRKCISKCDYWIERDRPRLQNCCILPAPVATRVLFWPFVAAQNSSLVAYPRLDSLTNSPPRHFSTRLEC
jgi:hypothetical protein